MLVWPPATLHTIVSAVQSLVGNFAMLSVQNAPKSLLTSNAYPNSKPSFPSPPPNSPLALLFPGKPLTPGPNKRPTRKYAAVAAKILKTRKWTNMKIKVNRIVAATEEV